jgi:hypothetical protein
MKKSFLKKRIIIEISGDGIYIPKILKLVEMSNFPKILKLVEISNLLNFPKMFRLQLPDLNGKSQSITSAFIKRCNFSKIFSPQRTISLVLEPLVYRVPRSSTNFKVYYSLGS